MWAASASRFFCPGPSALAAYVLARHDHRRSKTGYGQQTATELRLLKALLALEDENRVDLAITFLGAHAIRRSDRVGSLEVGKQADILILSVPDYRHLGYRYGTNLVKQVVKRGCVHSVDVGYYRTA